MPFPLFLGFLAFSLEFIPYIGPITAAVPAIVVGLAQSPTLAIVVAILLTLVQEVYLEDVLRDGASTSTNRS